MSSIVACATVLPNARLVSLSLLFLTCCARTQAGEVATTNTDAALALAQYQASTDADEVDLALIEALLMYVAGEGPYRREDEERVPGQALGAVLVFLPGVLVCFSLFCIKC